MTALAKNRNTDFAGLVPTRGTYPCTAAVRHFKGGIVVLDSAGRARPGTTIANGAVMCVGKASQEFDNTSGAAGAMDVEVEHGVFAYASAGGGDAIAADDIGQPCYVVDDQTVGLTDGGGDRILAGQIIEVVGAKIYVWMGPHVSASMRLGVFKKQLTVLESDLTAAATTQTLNLDSPLPAGARVVGADVRLATPFTGGGITAFTVSIGSAGDDDAIVAAANIFAAAVDGQASTRPLGIAPNKAFDASTQLTAKFDSTTANVVAATAGSCRLEVLYVINP